MKTLLMLIAAIVVMVVVEMLRQHPEVISNKNLAGIFVAFVFFVILLFSVGDLARGEFYLGSFFSSQLVSRKTNSIKFYTHVLNAILLCSISLFLIVSHLIKENQASQSSRTVTTMITNSAAQ